MNFLETNGKSFLREFHITAKGRDGDFCEMTISYSFHVKDGNVSSIYFQRQMVVYNWKAVVGAEEESFDDQIKVELENEKNIFFKFLKNQVPGDFFCF